MQTAGYVEKHLTPFGGVLPLEKLFDVLEGKEVFATHFIAPARTPELGHWRMVKGVLALQFIDTTVKTVYGYKEGARQGHNRQHRGKKALRPVLAFIAETKEYFAGKLRAGKTISGEQVKKFIALKNVLVQN